LFVSNDEKTSHTICLYDFVVSPVVFERKTFVLVESHPNFLFGAILVNVCSCFCFCIVYFAKSEIMKWRVCIYTAIYQYFEEICKKTIKKR